MPEIIYRIYFLFCCSVPLLKSQAFFQLLNFVFQLGHASRWARLALHLSHATPQLLQLQEHTQQFDRTWKSLQQSVNSGKVFSWGKLRPNLPQLMIQTCWVKQVFLHELLTMANVTRQSEVAYGRTCLSIAFLSSSRSCFEDLSCMSSERSWSIWSLLLATRSVSISTVLFSSSSSSSKCFSLSWDTERDHVNK